MKFVKSEIEIDTSVRYRINGVTSGTACTLGKIDTILGGLRCELHVVPNDFPIDTHG